MSYRLEMISKENAALELRRAWERGERRLIISIALLGLCSTAFSQPTPLYQVPFPGPVPTDGAAALASVAQRARAAITYEACANEFQFFGNAPNPLNGEGVLAAIIAKMNWIAGLPPTPVGTEPNGTASQTCIGDALYSFADVQGWFPDVDPTIWITGKNPWSPVPNQTMKSGDGLPVGDDFTSAMKKAYPGCSDFVATTTVSKAGDSGFLIHAQFAVSPQCMKAQINIVLANAKYPGTMAGTNGSYCLEQLKVSAGVPLPDFTVDGDWDVEVRDLTRIYYLNKAYGGQILNDQAVSNVRDYLLTLDKAPSQDAYSIWQCANTSDVSQGSTEDRADDDNAFQKDLDWIGDALKWLLPRLLLFEIVDDPLLKLLQSPDVLGMGAVQAADVGEIAALNAAAAGASYIQIPETENHRLMMETSRYLKNVDMANQLASEPGRADQAQNFTNYAQQGRDYLLKRMQGILQGDFIEYNARPYQRYSIISLLNLYDFAPDDKLRTAAQMLLEYASLKFAIAGNNGRRTVPFRRLTDETDGVTSIMDSTTGDDFQVSQMLFLAGQTQQLPEHADTLNPTGPLGALVSTSAAAEMVYLATSGFRPDASIVDLAVKKTPYYQQLSHAGAVEIYSGAPSYVISAGGVETPGAYSTEVSLPDFLGGGTTTLLDRKADHGAGVPTALIPAHGNGNTDRTQFFRIAGTRDATICTACSPDSQGVSYQGNTCVWRGFACGTNLATNTAPFAANNAAQCYVDSSGPWNFFDSSTCDRVASATPKFYVAEYAVPCPSNDAWCTNFKGFFEVVDNPKDISYDAFQTMVKNANPEPFDSFGTATNGVYHSYSGHTIEFDCEAFVHNSNKWGITRVDGVDQPDIGQWPFASGDIINVAKDGSLLIFEPQAAQGLSFNFAQWDQPQRSIVLRAAVAK